MTAPALIERLFGESLATFRAEAWPDRVRSHAGAPERLGELFALPALADPVTLLGAHRGVISLYRLSADGGYDNDTRLDAATAVEQFRGGAMLDLRDVQRWLPPVQDWLDQLVDELGIAGVARATYCHAFVSPAGTGVPKHFDNREVIVVQIRGQKQWTLAPNPALAHPLMPHVVGGPVHALNRHVPREVLTDPTMPPGAVTHVLEPGAALLVPRGTWHRTHALEDSLSLSFGLRVPSRVESFLEAVAAALRDDPAWQAPAYDLTVVRPPGVERFVAAMRGAIGRLRGS